jgi:hypothetical protein
MSPVHIHGESSLLTMSVRHRITGMNRIRGGWSKRRRHPLQDLMRECRYRKATEPRDKIYSLLGLMGDHMNDFYNQIILSLWVMSVSIAFRFWGHANKERYIQMLHVTLYLNQNL